MNTATLDTNFDALTLDQLDTASGGSFWSGVEHIAGNVAHSAKVAAQDMVNGAAAGGAGGGIVGAFAGPEAIPVGAAVGGALGGAAGLGYGIGHEVGGYLKKL
jgi:phage tail tape-measure protein